MRLYETTFILRPDLDEEAVAAAVSKVTTLITAGGGVIEGRDDWGKRRLAYEIDGERDGIYVILRFRAQPATLKELERLFRLTEEVLRHLVVRWEVPPPAEKPAESATASEVSPITPPQPAPETKEIAPPAPETETPPSPEVKEDA
ncbi:MAG: 30S ribosomal protein S6 [bacterium]|nr:30S ribosomal protein S6 [bacterium]